jgi:inner membrane transporter RhtA
MTASQTGSRPSGTPEGAGRIANAVGTMPPASFFAASLVFHYLGPSLAVLLFAHVAVLGVAWLRIASAAVVFAPGGARGAF